MYAWTHTLNDLNQTDAFILQATQPRTRTYNNAPHLPDSVHDILFAAFLFENARTVDDNNFTNDGWVLFRATHPTSPYSVRIHIQLDAAFQHAKKHTTHLLVTNFQRLLSHQCRANFTNKVT